MWSDRIGERLSARGGRPDRRAMVDPGDLTGQLKAARSTQRIHVGKQAVDVQLKTHWVQRLKLIPELQDQLEALAGIELDQATVVSIIRDIVAELRRDDFGGLRRVHRFLVTRGPGVMAELENWFAEEAWTLRFGALHVIAEFEGAHRGVARVWIEDWEKHIDTLGRFLEASSLSLRSKAAELLKLYGTEASAAIEPLVKATRDPFTDMRILALQAVSKIGAEAYHLEVLSKALSDEHGLVRLWGIRALATLGAAARSTIQDFYFENKDPDVKVRREAATIWLQLMKLKRK